MGLSDSKSPNFNNPGVQKPVSISRVTIPPTSVSAPLSQLRGNADKGSTGAGIPRQVTDVAVSIANAAAGSTSTVVVTFHRDPSDSAFSKANVYIRGYQGNQSLVQVGGGSESPITFTLSNTGEPINVVVQASGNAGDAPIATAPSRGIKLPLSTSGGYGASTVVSPPTQLVGDVVTAGTKSPLSATVDGIQTVGVSSVAPGRGDVLRYNVYGDSKWDIASAVPRFVMTFAGAINATPGCVGHDDGPVTVGTSARFTASGSEPPSETFTSAATASLNVVAGVRQGWGANISANEIYTYGSVMRMSQRVKMNNSSNVRYWLGVSEGNTADFTGSAALAVDNPNRNYAMFRFHAGVDSVIQAVCGTSSANQTVASTGVSVDTANSKLFEIAWVAGTAFKFYIDGVLCATITTNIPGTSNRFGTLVCCDNLNTNTGVGFAYYNSMLILR